MKCVNFLILADILYVFQVMKKFKLYIKISSVQKVLSNIQYNCKKMIRDFNYVLKGIVFNTKYYYIKVFSKNQNIGINKIGNVE